MLQGITITQELERKNMEISQENAQLRGENAQLRQKLVEVTSLFAAMEVC